MLPFLKKLFSRYGEDEIGGRAAALSYYAVFSIGPLLFLVLGVLGVVVKSSSARDHLLHQLGDTLGPKAVNAISGSLSAQGLGSKTSLAFWVGGIGLVLAAIGIFGQLQKSLNEILHVKTGPGAGKKPLIRQKLIALVLVGVVCALLLASLFTSAFISALASSAGHGWAFSLLFHFIDVVASLVILGLALSVLYRTLPAIKIAWGVLLKGSLIVALLFSIGKLVLGIIIGRNGAVSAYGAAGSLIALLLWIFYSGQIMYLGAAGIRLYLDSHPEKIQPRYEGKDSVMKIVRCEKPFKKPAGARAVDKFFAGAARGWHHR